MGATELNRILKGSVVERLLSSYGMRSYFPKGIVAQSQEAAQLATRANATAGVALEGGHYMTHPLFKGCSPLITSDEMVGYAPTGGERELRQLWSKELIRKNPHLEGKLFSLPVVSGGLTHSLTLAGELFLDPTDEIVIPSPCWDNYDLLYGVRRGCKIKSPSLFDEDLNFTLDNLKTALEEITTEKIFLLLNFPNNPSGYTPSYREVEELTTLLISFANQGRSLVVVIDDAYYGLVHTSEAYPYSLFSLLCDAHENILAVKCDAATKEALVWGFRIGFITYGAKGLAEEHYEALIQKTIGAVRATISSASKIGQSLLLKVMQGEGYLEECERVAHAMKVRYKIVKEAIAQEEGPLQPLPFNSGYFCAFKTQGEANTLREVLLKEGQIGSVALGGDLLRIAYSSVDCEQLAPLIEEIYRRSRELWR